MATPAGGSAEPRDSRESAWRRITPVLAGALVGVVPVLVNSHLQARAQMRQARLERRLAAMTDYSAACNRHAVALSHLANLPRIAALWSAELKDAGDRRSSREAMAGHAESALKEAYDTQAELAVQKDRVNALFRGHAVDPFALGGTPAAGSLLGREGPGEPDPDKAAALFREIQASLGGYVPKLKEHCGEAAIRLTDHLEDP